MNIETQARDIVFPIIEFERTDDGFKMLKLLGTGFYLNSHQNIGMTAFSVIENIPIQNICCLLVINNEFVCFSITNPQYNLGIVTFSIHCPLTNYGICINNQEHYASCNFFTWGYPNEYLHEVNTELFRPDIAYHQGYVVRRITMPELHKHNECLFEINLVLSEGCHGAPLLIKDTDNNWQLIGIYIGDRKFIIEKGYQEIMQIINSDNKFFEKLKSNSENFSIKELLKEIVNLIPGSIAIKFGFNIFNNFKDKKSEVELLNQIIKNKEQFKEIFKQIHILMSKEVYINYGLAIRASHLFEKI